MKKFMFIFSLFLTLVLVAPVFAAQNGQQVQTQTQQQLQASDSPTANQVQNQNQVQTQNQGKDSQLQVNNREQENLNDGQGSQTGNSTKAASPRSDVAHEKMSNVAQKVEELLTTQGAQGGIGDQVKTVAQEQKTAQTQIQLELSKIDQRGGLLKFLAGSDYKALKNMQKQMEQNQLRIQLLEQLQNQLINQSEITLVQETIQALTEQDTALQNRINLEGKSFSLLGWLFKLFTE